MISHGQKLQENYKQNISAASKHYRLILPQQNKKLKMFQV